MDAPDRAWHYTTAHGLIEIVTKHRLWATSAAYMNDRDEIRSGRAALQKAIEERDLPEWQLEQLKTIGVMRPANSHGLFLLCGSRDGDSLTLWRSYGAGGEAEYAIELDPTVPLHPIEQSEADSHPEPVPPGWYDGMYEYTDQGEQYEAYDPDEPYSYGGYWGEVQYLTTTSNHVEKELNELLAQLREPHPDQGRVFPFILDYLAGPEPTVLWKHPGFSDEQEVRATWWVGPWWKLVKYRPGRFGATPYIEVGAGEHAHRSVPMTLTKATTKHLPIRTVRIGPTRVEEYAESTLRELLNANGYGHVAIEKSETPYR